MFELIYALSVFTHLSQELQLGWMAEFGRIMEPGAHLLLTTHGESYLNIMTRDEQEKFGADQLVVRSDDASGTNACVTFHPERWVRQRLARGFAVVDFVPEAAKGNPHQDVWLLRKS